MNKYNIAIVGATGLVGRKILDCLFKENFPIKTIKLLASKRSAGKLITHKSKEYLVEEAKQSSFRNIDIAFFTAGASTSKRLVPPAIEAGAIVIDNTSAFRMHSEVPLVVPEVNSHALKKHQGIIANPNCSTIQLALSLSPIQKSYGIKRIVASTYQSISGGGSESINKFKNEILSAVKKDLKIDELAYEDNPFAFNLIPQIDDFTDNEYTKEEMKIINETKKILEDKNLQIAATCVRVPVFNSHSESVYIEVEKASVNKKDIMTCLSEHPSIYLVDDPKNQKYPTPLMTSNREGIYIGRIRKDPDIDKGFHLWIVSDNLLKGAALNSIHIGKALIKEGII